MNDRLVGTCPRCGQPTASAAAGMARFYCHRCRQEFEAIDDGDVGYGDPSRRMQRAERQQPRRRGKR